VRRYHRPLKHAGIIANIVNPIGITIFLMTAVATMKVTATTSRCERAAIGDIAGRFEQHGM